MTDSVKYIISKLSDFFETDSFFCDKEQLDVFIKRYALINQRNNLGQTYVLHAEKSPSIIGYYTISATHLVKRSLPSEHTSSLPSYPIPCVLIGKLAVDNAHQKKGFGKYLLHDALTKIKIISKTIGCYAVIVDALDSAAAKFYEKYGFIPFVDKELSLFLPIITIPEPATPDEAA